jgi:hypothetical protein
VEILDENGNENDLSSIVPSTIVSRIHKVVTTIRSSPKKEQDFLAMVSAAKIEPPNLTVIQDVATRWNATYHMLSRSQKLRVPIDMFIASDSTLKNCSLLSEEWKFLDHILSVLKPLDDVTNFLSSSKYPSLSAVIPCYSGCIEQIQSIAIDNSSFTSAQMAIEKKLGEYYQAALRKKVYATATILDPRFKAEYFRGRQDCVSVKRRFYQDAESYAKHSEKSTAEPPQENNLTWIDRLFKKSKLSNVLEEVKLYLSEPTICKTSDPLLYWKEKKEAFPCLYVMAMKHLSVCATSTPSERAFSGGRLICSHLRGSLSSEKLTALMCLKSWLQSGFDA